MNGHALRVMSDADRIKALEAQVAQLSDRVDWSLVHLMQTLNLLTEVAYATQVDGTTSKSVTSKSDDKALTLSERLDEVFEEVSKVVGDRK